MTLPFRPQFYKHFKDYKDPNRTIPTCVKLSMHKTLQDWDLKSFLSVNCSSPIFNVRMMKLRVKPMGERVFLIRRYFTCCKNVWMGIAKKGKLERMT